MKKVFFFLATLFACSTFANTALMNQNDNNPIVVCQPTKTVTLNAGTMVYLELAEQLRSQKLTVGRNVKFTVKMNVKAEGKTVIRTGSIAIGRIKDIQRSSYNDPEEITLEITNVQAVDGTMVELNGTEAIFLGENSGEGTTINALPSMTVRVMDNTVIDAN